MTALDLTRLKALVAAATPGPWHWVNPENDRPRQPGEWRASLRTVQEFPTHSSYTLPKFIVEADEIRDENMDANAAFIAAANPAAVGELIARLERAEAQLSAVTAGDLTESVDAAMVEMANIHPPLRRSECERLIRAALRPCPMPDDPLDDVLPLAVPRQLIQQELKRKAMELAEKHGLIKPDGGRQPLPMNLPASLELLDTDGSSHD